MPPVLRALMDDAKHGKWVGNVIAHARRRARQTADPTTQFVYVGMQQGALEAAEFLSPRLRRTALFKPKPDTAPASQAELHSYVAGYLAGHVMTTLFHGRAEAGLSLDGDEATSVGRQCAVYGAALAAPKVQTALALGSADEVLAAHNAAAITVIERLGPLDDGLDDALVGWLMAKASVDFTPSLRAAARHMARTRLARLRRRDAPSADSV